MSKFNEFLQLREKGELTEKEFSAILENIEKEDFFKIKEHMKVDGGYVNHLLSFKSTIELKKKEASFNN